MSRRYREHDLRHVDDLNGIWDFAFLGDVEPDDVDVRAIRYDDVMAVPGCFDAAPAYAGRRGVAAYRRRVAFRDAVPHRLVLDGAHHWCRVFVGGRKLGDHVGGFTPFGLDIPRPRVGEADVVLLIDNRFNYDRCPIHEEYYDWYHFGGLARGAELHRLGRLWIDSARVTTTDWRRRKVHVRVEWGKYLPGGAARGPGMDSGDRAKLIVTCAGKRASLARRLKGASGTIELDMELSGAALWSPDAPNLHEMHIRLGDDDLRLRVGIRQVAVDSRHFIINGRAVELMGFCRHESHPQFGHALPDALIAADVQQLLDMGCNFVRGSHYPQDRRFLDLCDEKGLCVWDEAIAWQPKAEHLTDPKFLQAQLRQCEEMVASAANHPSVVLWGVFNEGRSDEEASVDAYAAALGRLRELDPTRPVSYATCRFFQDRCYHLADVIGINCYPGWYFGEIEGIPAYIDGILAHLEKVGQGDKPVIISEIGGGAVPGWRDVHGARWSEQYQARLLETAIRYMFRRRAGRFAALSIWQFGDCRTGEDPGRAMGRPRCFNNKGVVDEYRRPKLAYETVKKLFRELRQLPAGR